MASLPYPSDYYALSLSTLGISSFSLVPCTDRGLLKDEQAFHWGTCQAEHLGSDWDG